ncbi:hypothetical protein GCM10028809_60870 [Spirosoma gilvum]
MARATPRIVLEGLQGEQSVAEICPGLALQAGMTQPRRRTAPISTTAGSDRRSGKEFLEAGKKRLAGNTIREATAPEVQSIKSENEAPKQLVAELSRFSGPTRK